MLIRCLFKFFNKHAKRSDAGTAEIQPQKAKPLTNGNRNTVDLFC